MSFTRFGVNRAKIELDIRSWQKVSRWRCVGLCGSLILNTFVKRLALAAGRLPVTANRRQQGSRRSACGTSRLRVTL